MPGDSRGTSDHCGPHPGRRRQPLPHWSCKAGWAAGLQLCLSVCRLGRVWEGIACTEAWRLALVDWKAKCRSSADLQCPAGQAPRLLPAALPQPSAELSQLCLHHRPRGRLLLDGCTAPGAGPGPGPAARHRYPHLSHSTSLRAEPHRSKEHWTRPELLTSLCVHSFMYLLIPK